MSSRSNKKQGRITIEEQLRILAECGIAMRPGRTVNELLVSWSREGYESEPFTMLLHMLGAEVVDGPAAGEPFSDDVWTLDAECIEDTGDYARIAKGLRRLAKGDLPLEDIKDHVDIENDEAWLSFRLDGVEHRWEPELNDDRLDPEIMTRFGELLASRSTGREFAMLEPEGQEGVMMCLTDEQFRKLKKATGLKLIWM